MPADRTFRLLENPDRVLGRLAVRWRGPSAVGRHLHPGARSKVHPDVPMGAPGKPQQSAREDGPRGSGPQEESVQQLSSSRARRQMQSATSGMPRLWRPQTPSRRPSSIPRIRSGHKSAGFVDIWCRKPAEYAPFLPTTASPREWWIQSESRVRSHKTKAHDVASRGVPKRVTSRYPPRGCPPSRQQL